MTAELKALGALPYAVLRERVEEGPSLLGVTFLTRGEWEVKEVEAPSGRVYNVEINVVWDDKPQGAVRVMVAVDDGGPSARTTPLVGDLIRTPPDAG